MRKLRDYKSNHFFSLIFTSAVIFISFKTGDSFVSDKFIENDFEEHYVPQAFEQICRQFLIRKNRTGELEESFEKIGKYWYDDPVNHKNGEFDVVTENEGNYIFWEAKFREEKLDPNLIWNEIQQVNNTGLVCRRYGFFSKSGYKKIEDSYKKQLILYVLDDLYR